MSRMTLLLLLISMTSAAEPYLVPVPTSVDVHAVDERSDSAVINSGLQDIEWDRGGYVPSDQHWTYGLLVEYTYNTGRTQALALGPYTIIQNNNHKNVAEILRGVFEQSGPAFTAVLSPIGVKDIRSRCVGWGYVYGAAHAVAACHDVPPTSSFCSLTSPAIVFDHGVVDERVQGGATARADLTVECSSGTNVRITLQGSGDGRLPIGGGTATIRHNDAELGSSIPMEPGVNTLHLTSELRGVSTGEWTASGVLVLEPA